jgi:putative solute:sodium symporter small subunit
MNADAASQGEAPREAPVKTPEEELEQAVQTAVQAAQQETTLAEKASQALADRDTLDKLGKRERIVLAKRRNSRPVVRTLSEVEELTDIGKALLNRLVWVQLRLAMWLLLLIVVVLVSISLAFLLAPSLDTTSMLGFQLPWLLLGFAVYPVFVAVAWFYNRSAERTERDFAEWVEN